MGPHRARTAAEVHFQGEKGSCSSSYVFHPWHLTQPDSASGDWRGLHIVNKSNLQI